MIDRQKGKILFECETCDEVLDTQTGDFTEALAKMQAEGWANVGHQKIGMKPTYTHYCPNCRGNVGRQV
jgi:hypothetical protein